MKIDFSELAGLSERLLEDRLYEMTVLEVESGDYDKSAKARALEEAQGNEARAKALYIKHRVRRLRDLLSEQHILNEFDQEQSEKAKRQQKLADAENEYKVKTAFMSLFEKCMYDLGRKLKK